MSQQASDVEIEMKKSARSKTVEPLENLHELDHHGDNHHELEYMAEEQDCACCSCCGRPVRLFILFAKKKKKVTKNLPHTQSKHLADN